MQGSRCLSLISWLLIAFLVQLSTASMYHEIGHIGEITAVASADIQDSDHHPDSYSHSLCSGCVAFKLIGWGGDVGSTLLPSHFVHGSITSAVSFFSPSSYKAFAAIRAPPVGEGVVKQPSLII